MKIGIGFAVALIVMFFAWAIVAGSSDHDNFNED